MSISARVGRLAASAIVALLSSAGPVLADPEFLDQGWRWSSADRKAFYSQDQGSRVMPLSWMKALKLPNGAPFLDGDLSRYGYLPNPDSPAKLPVGFTSATADDGTNWLGMTCSACHTRQITVSGQDYRIDGGPAIVDFQAFLTDLGLAMSAVLATDASFDAFAREVLGSGADDPTEKAKLKVEVDLWYLRYATLMKRALPDPPWGPGRLDAVGMIFNRLTGLDLGPPPTYLIADNIKPADAPVRYPFLWNAPIQDKTQWPGFADNGNDILGLARNVGEVYGVFAQFTPTKNASSLFGVDYITGNSANFSGLRRLEDLIEDLGPPEWPFPVDRSLAGRGKGVFNRSTAAGGCVDCHGIKSGAIRPILNLTWATPVQDVGTDSREYAILGWEADTGSMNGASIPFLTSSLKPTDRAFNVLGTAVIGSIIQNYLLGDSVLARHLNDLEARGLRIDLEVPKPLQALRGAYPVLRGPSLRAAGEFAYESRVMEGIWATAPYLHNGSVPTLADLLERAEDRPARFVVGPNYDIERVGIATEQTKFTTVLETTDCSKRDSGNSRCGHEFGTDLNDEDKKALLEYLKTL